MKKGIVIFKIILAALYTVILIPAMKLTEFGLLSLLFLLPFGLIFNSISDAIVLAKVNKIRMLLSILAKVSYVAAIFIIALFTSFYEFLDYGMMPIGWLLFIYSALLPFLIKYKTQVDNFIKKYSLSYKYNLIQFTASLIIFLLYFGLSQIVFCFSAGVKTFSIIVRIIIFVFLSIELFASLLAFIVSLIKKNVLKNILCVAFELIMAFVIGMPQIVNSLSFFPHGYDVNNLASYENTSQITIDVDHHTYSGIFINNHSSTVTLYFPGNGMDAYTTLKSLYSGLDKATYDVLIVDYPMFGKSTGNLTQKNLFKEADAFYDYLANNPQYSEINVAGFSIGTGMANYVTSHHEVNKLTLGAPYDNFTHVYNTYANIFYPPFSWMTAYKFTSDEYAKSITCPVTIVYILDDHTVPCELALSLATNYPNEPTLIKLDRGGHNYVPRDEEFLSRVLGYTL